MQIENKQMLKHWYDLNSSMFCSATMGYSSTANIFVSTEILQKQFSTKLKNIYYLVQLCLTY